MTTPNTHKSIEEIVREFETTFTADGELLMTEDGSYTDITDWLRATLEERDRYAQQQVQEAVEAEREYVMKHLKQCGITAPSMQALVLSAHQFAALLEATTADLSAPEVISK